VNSISSTGKTNTQKRRFFTKYWQRLPKIGKFA